MRNIGIFCDVSNLYYCLIRKHGPTARLDYNKYLDYCNDLGTVVMANAYGVKASGDAVNFIHHLKMNGYNPKFKQPRVFKTANGIIHKADCDVDIAVDVFKSLDDFDTVILGTADGDFKPLLEHCAEAGKQVIIIGCKISKPLRDVAHSCVEIPKSMLKE